MVHCGVEGRGIVGAIALSDSLRCSVWQGKPWLHTDKHNVKLLAAASSPISDEDLPHAACGNSMAWLLCLSPICRTARQTDV